MEIRISHFQKGDDNKIYYTFITTVERKNHYAKKTRYNELNNLNKQIINVKKIQNKKQQHLQQSNSVEIQKSTIEQRSFNSDGTNEDLKPQYLKKQLELPQFPEKKWFGNKKEEFLSKRASQLQKYIFELLSFCKQTNNTEILQIIKEFFAQTGDQVLNLKEFQQKYQVKNCSVKVVAGKSLEDQFKEEWGQFIQSLQEKFSNDTSNYSDKITTNHLSYQQQQQLINNNEDNNLYISDSIRKGNCCDTLNQEQKRQYSLNMNNNLLSPTFNPRFFDLDSNHKLGSSQQFSLKEDKGKLDEQFQEKTRESMKAIDDEPQGFVTIGNPNDCESVNMGNLLDKIYEEQNRQPFANLSDSEDDEQENNSVIDCDFTTNNKNNNEQKNNQFNQLLENQQSIKNTQQQNSNRKQQNNSINNENQLHFRPLRKQSKSNDCISIDYNKINPNVYIRQPQIKSLDILDDTDNEDNDNDYYQQQQYISDQQQLYLQKQKIDIENYGKNFNLTNNQYQKQSKKVTFGQQEIEEDNNNITTMDNLSYTSCGTNRNRNYKLATVAVNEEQALPSEANNLQQPVDQTSPTLSQKQFQQQHQKNTKFSSHPHVEHHQDDILLCKCKECEGYIKNQEQKLQQQQKIQKPQQQIKFPRIKSSKLKNIDYSKYNLQYVNQ